MSNSNPSERTLSSPDTNSIPEPHNITSFNESTLIPVDYSPPTYTNVNKDHRINIPKADSQPVSVYTHPYGEEMAFPWLFPTGHFGFCNH